ncbi:pyridoxamine 5'-phosphate oxidase [Pontibacter sp. E15-1]|uniref:pyridoxamine 5'-phosphate oxidase n=1 Tax=Pontibacter sp. E15-1 TaxID=2919918 RepID=UPI001F4FD639|nr:pyridoxamine 5'-phosphate oxidase [Pontibacter sp. E15-1]MCJ8163568.1 pyridoxamine 5'-phosphate oxidase [Pontibacter sp. E15-1]
MALNHNIAAIRKNYAKQALTEASAAADPVDQFNVWLNEALQAEVDEPTALVLATVSADNRPSARVVLLKDVSPQGFAFFTNYDSRKGQELAQRPAAAITFFWPALERQVRIEGNVVQVSAEMSDRYFHSRPKGSQIGAWASAQSVEIESREALEEADRQFTERFKDEEIIPRPANWGGYQLQPTQVEFWQGRPNRLHDRLLYTQQPDGSWEIKRLAP